MKIAFTGHRPERLGLGEFDYTDIYWNKICICLIEKIIKYIDTYEKENIDIYCGMARGSDLAWGYAALLLKDYMEYLKDKIEASNKDYYKDEYVNIKIHCVFPCKGYNEDNEYVKIIKEHADEVIYIEEEYNKNIDKKRDEYMLDQCDVLVAFWDNIKSGGVWSNIKHMKKKNRY